MMKKLLLIMCALATSIVVNAQARVYAYGLTQSGDDVVTVSFKTNVAATSAKVLLSAEGQTDVTVDATSDDGKNWTAVINPSGDFVANVKYNWSVEVSADAVTAATMVYGLGFNRPSTVAVDNSPESDYFGNVYMTENKGGSGSAYDENASSTALYTWDASLSTPAYYAISNLVGDATVRNSAPRALTVTSDGQVYAAACDSEIQGIYNINPATFTATQTLSGEKVYGIGANGNDLYYIVDNANSGYDINSTNQDFTPFTTVIKDIATYPHKTIVPVEQGIWVHYSDYSNSDDTKNHVHFVDYSGNLKWTINSTVKTDRGGFAIDKNNNVLAYYVNGKGVVYYDYTFDATGTPALSNEQTVPSSIVATSTRSEAMAFDYAGNLYVVSCGGEWIKVIALPTDNNTCTTPAKKSLTIAYTQGQIEATGIETIGADDNAPVEYYNLQGVKVENPENGIFIKKQGNKAVKVIL